ncbi:MAG: glycosyl transferase, family 25 [Massilia sp.]|jgi:GR25 family glycosyltransferase involved in LPS biosynthesis
MPPTVKVISLARSLERRATFAASNAHIDFAFFDAVEGASVMGHLHALPELFDRDVAYLPGAVGCALSHLTLWKEAADTNKVVTVLEDDAILRFDFHEQYAHALKKLPADWDMVVWGWNFDSVVNLNVMPGISPVVMTFNQNQLRESIPAFQELTIAPQLLPLSHCFGTPAYSISPAGGRKFIENCFPLNNFKQVVPGLPYPLPNNGIDMVMNRIYGATRSFCSMPPLAVTENDTPNSTIGTGVR